MNVLLVDDDSTFRFIVKTVSKRSGLAHIIAEAENGHQAIKYLNTSLASGNGIPDIIFLDLNMPEMNGWEFLECIPGALCKRAEIPVCIVSSSISRHDNERSQTYSCVKGMFSKPLTEGHLRKMQAFVAKV